jgi:hypothetical protein
VASRYFIEGCWARRVNVRGGAQRLRRRTILLWRGRVRRARQNKRRPCDSKIRIRSKPHWPILPPRPPHTGPARDAQLPRESGLRTHSPCRCRRYDVQLIMCLHSGEKESCNNYSSLPHPGFERIHPKKSFSQAWSYHVRSTPTITQSLCTAEARWSCV